IRFKRSSHPRLNRRRRQPRIPRRHPPPRNHGPGGQVTTPPPIVYQIDLSYLPWNSADAAQFGHGEVASLLRLLNLARLDGIKYHVFVSTPVLRIFPAAIEAVLGDL